MTINNDSILALATLCTALASLAHALRSLYGAANAKRDANEDPDCSGRHNSLGKPGVVCALPRCHRKIR